MQFLGYKGPDSIAEEETFILYFLHRFSMMDYVVCTVQNGTLVGELALYYGDIRPWLQCGATMLSDQFQIFA